MAAPQVFPFRPTVETAAEVKFRTLSAQFGDGYKQVVGDGINIRSEAWTLTFRGKWARGAEEVTSSRVYISEVKAALDALEGFHPLLWTPRDGVQAMYEVPSYKLINHHNGLWTLSATFQQVY
jgi:phage-related protein